MKITVLAGGASTERDVSICSGKRIAEALRGNGHRVLLLDLCANASDLANSSYDLFTRDGRNDLLFSNFSLQGNSIGEGVLECCRKGDLVFLALHGGIGENGTIQAILESVNIPYTGSGAVGSMLAMDKDLTKQILRQSQIPTPDWALYHADRAEFSTSFTPVGFPCVVKPANGGSSIGVFFANSQPELEGALRSAGAYCNLILVEKKIDGRELTVGVLGERVLPPVEILPKNGVYDYSNKYNGTTEERCPADLSPKIVRELTAYAQKAFAALRLCDYARFDFLLDEEERLWCLEANTLPGMTPTSLFPLEAESVGISYAALCELLVQLAVKNRH